jgi:hypothetical protein
MARRCRQSRRLSRSAQTGKGASFVLWQDEESIAWLNVVPGGRDTGYHDHDGSAVGVYVPEGSVTNEGLPNARADSAIAAGP